MCGRTCLSVNRDQIRCACSYKSERGSIKPQWIDEHNAGKDYVPSYNIAPTDVTPVLVSSSKFNATSKQNRILKPMMWGLVPPWHKGDYKTHNLSTNNCRLENICSSKLYSPILNSGGRCVIVVEGFYEWQTTNKSAQLKQPYYIYSPQNEGVKIDNPDTWNNTFDNDNGWEGVNLLYMAGLYDVWQDGNTIIYSYSVITMDSSNTFDWLHHRMPAILDTQEQIEAWLDIDKVNPDKALSYLRQSKSLSWHPVSTLVNNSRNKSENCNKRILLQNKATQKTINSFFIKSQKRSSGENESEAKRIKK
ncbi:hypothetical protein K1T71_012221 [Dendrolimus kikuchii]|uniref:Uncharacterized protein n=1 Tax=Dendrolimus kikuchii TaxID=765133 RepID=A0ACC1CKX5_9NEOP|nr:hypothetical protein K1T71_012221 [Dendrolimus kikuchii]